MMTDFELFFKPVVLERLHFVASSSNRFGDKIDIHTVGHFPHFEGVSVALIGIEEERGSKDNKGCGMGADAIREQLYPLFYAPTMPKMLDLGNLISGKTLKDTYAILADIVETLLKNNIIPILLGSSQDITFANYLAYEQLQQVVNIVSIDSKFDIGNSEQPIDSHNFAGVIAARQPNFLFNYSNIGYQTYFVSHEDVALMDDLFFDAFRLGLAKKDIFECEPVVRNADIFSLDMGSLCYSVSPACRYISPNGFTGVEICQLAYFAGLSNKISSFGIYEYNPLCDVCSQSAMLIAQVIWYFLDGISKRTDEHPALTPGRFNKITVVFENLYDVIFYRSKVSGMWWMEVPIDPVLQQKYNKHYLVPCSAKDYQTASKNDILPERWLQTFKKIKPSKKS